MRLEEAREELKRFVKQKTTQQPAFLGVILDALDAAEQLDLYHGGEIRCYFEGNMLKELPKYVTEIAFETEEDQKEFEARIKDMYKYRWHDLRKDPDDLPEDGDIVLMAGRLGTNALYGTFEFHADEGWFDDGINDKDVIYRFMYAWKYIDPFEEVE